MSGVLKLRRRPQGVRRPEGANLERRVRGLDYPDGICVLHTAQKRDDEFTRDVGTFLLLPK